MLLDASTPPPGSGLLAPADATAAAQNLQGAPGQQIGPRNPGGWLQEALDYLATPRHGVTPAALAAMMIPATPEGEAPEAIARRMLTEEPELRLTGPGLRLGGDIHSGTFPESHVTIAGKLQQARGADWWYNNAANARPDQDLGFMLSHKVNDAPERYVSRSVGQALAELNGQFNEGAAPQRNEAPGLLHSHQIKAAPTTPTKGLVAPAPEGADPVLHQLSERYRAAHGITAEGLPPVSEVNPEAHRYMGETYERLQSDPDNMFVRAHYKQFMDETNAQFQALKDAGYTFDFSDTDPYVTKSGAPSSKKMLQDLRENKHLSVLKTNDASAHPILTNRENDVFRAVHDALGHGVNGYTFDKVGEENAFRAHQKLYSPEAQRVLGTETRGQNSWTNFGPHQPENMEPPKRPFAAQKAALWPPTHLGDYNTVLGNRPAGGGLLRTFGPEDIKMPEGAPEYLGGQYGSQGTPYTRDPLKNRRVGTLGPDDATTLGYRTAHYLRGAPDFAAWGKAVAAEHPELAPVVQNPSTGQRIYEAAKKQEHFVNDFMPRSELHSLADAAEHPEQWDKWYGPMHGALRDAGLSDQEALRATLSSSALSVRKPPYEEVKTMLNSLEKDAAGKRVTTADTEHTIERTQAVRGLLKGGTLGKGQKINAYGLAETRPETAGYVAQDTWHGRAVLGKNLDRYLDRQGNINLTDAQWHAMQGYTQDAAQHYQGGTLLPHQYQARVWGGITGYSPAAGGKGADRLYWLKYHLGHGEYPALLKKHPGLQKLADEGKSLVGLKQQENLPF